ncbi:MAG: MTAP family purine nucleoside phosphorylase [Armatimonadota bacterium]
MHFGLIGGTGLDEMDCFANGHRQKISSRFGDADVIEAEYGGHSIVFVPRHGFDHSAPPGSINYRAQIAALRVIGVDAVLGVCAVGSLKSDLLPGSFVVLSDFIDLTKRRVDTFFDAATGPVVHTDFSEPYCAHVSASLIQGCKNASGYYKTKGVYIGVEGPRYESPAEVRLYASWGADVIGMTNVPEVILAKEAGLCYGAVAIVTNLATGISDDNLSHDEVRAEMAKSMSRLQSVLLTAVNSIPHLRQCSCRSNRGLII